MTIQEVALHCEKAWSQFAEKHNITRDDPFYLFKMQEELGELTRSFLELRGSEKKTETDDKIRQKFEGDCASLVGNALILALHFGIEIEKTIHEKFPVSS